MKKRDSITCIKDYGLIGNKSSFFEKNKKYTIVDVRYISDYKKHFNGIDAINYENLTPSTWITIINFEGDIREFSVKKMKDINYLYDYFIHPTKILNNKLKKIKNT